MKTQMKFQKIMCLVMLLAGALSAVYCFIYCSAGLANIGLSLSPERDAVTGEYKFDAGFEKAQQLYLDVQPFNTALLILSIIMIIAAAILYITATNKRRNYYISNYVATGLICAVDIGTSLYVLIMNSIFLSRFKAIISDPVLNAKYQEIAAGNETINYVTSTWNFALGYVVYILVIAACVGLILNLVWKLKLMRGEKQLLSGEKVATDKAVEVA